MLSIRTVRVLICVGVCVAAAPDTHGIAQQKLTPGGTALLVNQKTPENAALLVDAVTHSDPDVRRVAARVIAAVERKDLLPLLLKQLAGETDENAAAEQVRAILVLGGVDALSDAKAAAARVGGSARLVLAEWLARRNADLFASSVDDLAAGLNDDVASALGPIAAMAVRQHPASRDRITQALARQGKKSIWQRFLDTLGATALEDREPLNAGFNATSSDIREITIWFALKQVAYGQILPAAQTRPTNNADTITQDTELARVGRELLGRVVEKSPPTDIAPLLKGFGSARLRELGRLSTLTNLLSRDERAALRAALGEDLDPPKPGEAVGSIFASLGANATTRTFTALTPRFFDSLMKELGCSIGSNDQELGAARVTYFEDGRVRDVQVDTSQLSKVCAPAIGVLGFLTVAASEHVVRADEPQWLMLPKDRDVLACWDLPVQSTNPAADIDETLKVKPPTRVRNVNPAYPGAAIQARIQGVVIIESTIGPTGCVTGGKVIRSIPLLDLPALRAVSSWRYTPTLVNGKPVPVTMTVTVNFTLR